VGSLLLPTDSFWEMEFL